MAAGATGAGDGLFRGMYEGSISGTNIEVDRRPYHKNCSCALHDGSKSNNGTKTCPHHKKVSFPIRRSWSEGSLSLYAVVTSNAGASSSMSPSPCSSPAAAAAIDNIRPCSSLSHHYLHLHQHQHHHHHQHHLGNHHLSICNEDDHGDDLFPSKM